MVRVKSKSELKTKISKAGGKKLVSLYQSGQGISNKVLYKLAPDVFPGGK
jgi:hypothetical protein